MPHRKLVKIGESPKLPTIEEFFLDMAARQHDEIRKLKEEIAGQTPREAADFGAHDPRRPVPDPWLLHPTRIKRTPAKKAAKESSPRRKASAKKTSARTSRPARKIAKRK